MTENLIKKSKLYTFGEVTLVESSFVNRYILKSHIGADPMVIRASGPDSHKNLVVGSSVARIPTKIALK